MNSEKRLDRIEELTAEANKLLEKLQTIVSEIGDINRT